VTGKCKSVNRSFVLFLPSLGSNSVPKYLSRKAKKKRTFGFSFVGPEERTQTLIGAGFQSGSTEQSWSPTSGRIAIHTGKTAIPAPFMANVR